jgi:23S rRNA pseudouridine1911/1915/1917 synthase
MDISFSAAAEPRIVYSDDDFLVVHKPARLHTAPLSSGGPDLASWVFERFPKAAAFPGPEGGLIHRLDFETSGLVLFALTDEAFKALQTEQAADSIRKDYLLRVSPSVPLAGLSGSRPERGRPWGIEAEAWDKALLAASEGSPEGGAAIVGLIEAAAAWPEIRCRFRTFGPGAARVACIGEGEDAPRGRHRRGSPERLYRSEVRSARACSELEQGELEFSVSITRGFRHQIRAHFAWLGLPLCGDATYGGLPADRLYLQASGIEFDSPRTGKRLRFEV